ncbi:MULTISPECIES: alpha-L-rhamnosidase [unclassified Paenibacillus]|uniref:alpha-L-rhamnosidase n=1 Tax=unclassified Paenibacillus TaxID=185978 RepID=UPI000CFD4264|nr:MULTISPECIES: alpha-L-rhamnosidase [unclassified Paenibacillus]PRA09469.1 alpha-L-rhamnosidase [Paenibacillus sp. MYb63]PRA46223.1 alpha-L-rhamnosidase [Paenibacillus sp. MYb67]QZN73695.1 glycoside hydrolase family 78 protein [Paenibacillus sp. DR312]
MLKAILLKTEYLTNPLGIDIVRPEFAWNLVGDSKKQTAYEIIAAHTKEELDKASYVWSSGKVSSASMTHVPYGADVRSRERIYWKVRVWDEHDVAGEWSETAFFEMGLLERQDWKAEWICGDYEPKPGERYPVDEFSKTFQIPAFVKARMYITACGIYETSLNGMKVGDMVLTPGVTSYEKRIQYQVYDITKQLQSGVNRWDISLGDGWFRGKQGVFGATNVFGTQTCALGQIEITGTDGTTTYIGTDGSFRWSNDGPVRFNDMKDGETIVAALSPSYKGQARVTEWETLLCCSNNVPVKEKETFKPTVLLTPDGSTVLDFGQVIAGYPQFSIQGKQGHTVVLTMGEMLDSEGNFTLSNVVQEYDYAPDYCDDSRFQTIIYSCGSEARETWKPKFCIQGFRYVKLDNWPEPVQADHFTAIAVYSDMEQTGQFSCSSPYLEKLVNNTLWSMKGNFLDVPTDCPTRERAAWTGDAQLFFHAGRYFMDFTAFFRKWMQDVFDDQAADGKVYNIVPRVAPHGEGFDYVEGSSGWIDAGILIPYRYWKTYGDLKQLANWYEPMTKLADFMINRMGDTSDPDLDQKLEPSEHRQYIVTTGFHFGEWNEPDREELVSGLPKYEEATAYLAYSLNCLSQISDALGKQKDASKYFKVSERAKAAYQYYFVKNGTISTNKMAKLVRPLALDLLDQDMRKNVEHELISLVREREHHVGTGFLSTPFILKALSDAGYVDDAYQMLEKEDYPSWIYQIKQGATTIWENWNGEASRNHYSNGAVCDWIFNTVCGINLAGENQFLISPQPGGSLTEAYLTYQSIYGKVSCSWRKESAHYVYWIEIPAGCQAEINIQGVEPQVVEAGKHCFKPSVQAL